MENNKTLTYLYSRGVNRFAKVVYMIFYGVILLFIYGLTIGDGGYYGDFFISLFIAIVIFELVKRGFYYIILGTIKPKK